MAPTLKMIAERAGIAVPTVSLILNRKPNDFSSEETRKKVFAIAEELGYKQKFAHKLLRGDKTNTAALLVATHEMSVEEHIQQLIFHLFIQFEKRGYSLYVTPLENNEERNLRTIDELCSRGTEYFLFIGDPVGGEKIRSKLAENHKRTVGYWSPCPFAVKSDPVDAIKKILKFFLDSKRENFKMIVSEKSLRLNALYELFPEVPQEELRQRHQITLDHSKINPDLQERAEAGYFYTQKLLQSTPDISAIFYHSDYFAVGGIRCLLENGRIPGKDVLVAGVNNIHAVRTGFFPVSSISHPLERIADVLLEGICSSATGQVDIPLQEIIRK